MVPVGEQALPVEKNNPEEEEERQADHLAE